MPPPYTRTHAAAAHAVYYPGFFLCVCVCVISFLTRRLWRALLLFFSPSLHVSRARKNMTQQQGNVCVHTHRGEDEIIIKSRVRSDRHAPGGCFVQHLWLLFFFLLPMEKP